MQREICDLTVNTVDPTAVVESFSVSKLSLGWFAKLHERLEQRRKRIMHDAKTCRRN
jgi:hypothetical protein